MSYMNGDTQKQPEGGNWQFKPDDATPQAQPVNAAQPQEVLETRLPLADPEDFETEVPAPAPSPEVSWSASEFIAHEKGIRWFLGLGAVTLVLALFGYFVIHDMVAVVAIILIAIIFGIMATHKPRVLSYHIGPEGVTVGNRTFTFAEFKHFGVIHEEAFSNITLIPTGRFAPTLSIYYPPEQEEQIVDVLSKYMPFAPVQYDGLDRFLRRIRL
jgi:hypothetical protein